MKKSLYPPFLFQGRQFSEIPLFKGIKEEMWRDPEWQKKNIITTPEQLAQVIRLNAKQKEYIRKSIKLATPMKITPYYASLMRENPFEYYDDEGKYYPDRIDPIFRQAVPTPAAYLFKSGKEDMGEAKRSYGCVYQRYPNRVAFLVTTVCFMYCNHCQRKKNVGKECMASKNDIDKGFNYIRKNTNIEEILFTGGDPLTLPLKMLKYLLDTAFQIKHIKIVRIGSRVPVTAPFAITDELVKLLSRYYPLYMPIHCNHYHEITPEFYEAIKKLRKAGITILNQMVALNGVNDTYEAVAKTNQRLYEVGVKPYYIFQCHKVQRVGEYIVPIQKMRKIVHKLRGYLSGPAIPTYAVNMDGGGGKVNLTPSGYAWEEIGFLDDQPYKPIHQMQTWDGKIVKYHELLSMNKKNYERLVATMDDFYGCKGKFNPSVNLLDEKGKYIMSTNVNIENFDPGEILGYKKGPFGMIDNPNDAFKKTKKKS